MDLPARDEARTWVGRTVVDREGAELGTCTAVLADESTGRPEWLYVEVEGARAVVPAVDADGSAGTVRVPVTRAQVTGAPSVASGLRLTQDQESSLYRHYGIEASRAASETLLPAAAAGSQGSTGRGPLAAALGLAAVAGIGVAGARSRRTAAPESAVQRLWSRRPWAPQPQSTADLVAGQVLAASALARDGARQLASVAAPLAAVAAETARHQTLRAGEGARHLARVAAPMAAAAAETARHRAVLGAEQLRHGARLASSATATRLRPRG